MKTLKSKKLLLFLVPALVLYLGLFIYPAIQSFNVSFHNWTGFSKEMEFVGLANYKELFSDSVFWSTLANTLIILFVGGAVIFFIAFLYTGFFTSGVRGKKIFRAIIFYPNVVAPIALAVFWSFLYNPRFGLINEFLRLMNLDFLTRVWTGPELIFWSVLVALIWTYVGFYLILLLSGAEKIPQSMYEVGKIEGANRIQMFFKVTIPLIWDVLVISLVLWVISAIKLFEFLFAFSGGFSIPREIWTNSVYMFILTFGKRNPIFRLGYGSAVAVSLLLLIIIFTGIVRIITKREKIEY